MKDSQLERPMQIAAGVGAQALVGKLVLVDRGVTQNAAGQSGHAVLVCGVLIAEDGSPLSQEVLEAATSEQWDVEVVLRPIAQRRGLTWQKGGISSLVVGDMLTNRNNWDEERDPDSGEWRPI